MADKYLVLPNQTAPTISGGVSDSLKDIIQEAYCTSTSTLPFGGLITYVDDFDPNKGFKYKMIGSTIRYMWPSVKEGSYLVSKKHNTVPLYIETIKGQHIIANSISRDFFQNYDVDDYEVFLLNAFNNAIVDNLNWLFYQIFKGNAGEKFFNNLLFDTFDAKWYSPSDASSNGYPIYQYLTFELNNASKSVYKVTQNPLKTDLDSVRTKISKCKVESEKELAEIKKQFDTPSLFGIEEDLEHAKKCALLYKSQWLVKDMINNPTKYSINKFNGSSKEKYDEFSYRITEQDLIVVYNPETKRKFEMVNTINSTKFNRSGFVVSSLAQTLECDCFPENKVLIMHKDAIKVIINGSKTLVWTALHEDQRITNYNSTLAFMIGTIDYLPLCVVQPKT